MAVFDVSIKRMLRPGVGQLGTYSPRPVSLCLVKPNNHLSGQALPTITIVVPFGARDFIDAQIADARQQPKAWRLHRLGKKCGIERLDRVPGQTGAPGHGVNLHLLTQPRHQTGKTTCRTGVGRHERQRLRARRRQEDLVVLALDFVDVSHPFSPKSNDEELHFRTSPAAITYSFSLLISPATSASRMIGSGRGRVSAAGTDEPGQDGLDIEATVETILHLGQIPIGIFGELEVMIGPRDGGLQIGE